jgi:hypothetical protein
MPSKILFRDSLNLENSIKNNNIKGKSLPAFDFNKIQVNNTSPIIINVKNNNIKL